MGMKKIVIFGDSLLKGVVLNEERYMLSKDIDWKAIEEKLGVKIDNRSRMGATVRYGYESLKKFLESGEECYAAILEFGGNDCDYNWKEVGADGTVSHPPKTIPEDFEKTLGEMVDMLIERGIKPILMTLPPISAQKYYDWFMRQGMSEENIMKHLGDINVIYRHQEYYNNIVASIAARKCVDIVDVREKFLLKKDFLKFLCDDGIHPNAHGGQIIVQAFLDKYSA